MTVSANSSAALIARFLRMRGVKRVFALCGGHIMPIWMHIDAEGVQIIDVRDERAAVHMAHAHAELTGELGVALVDGRPRRDKCDHRHRQRFRGARAGSHTLGHAPPPPRKPGQFAGFGSRAARSIHHPLCTHGTRACPGPPGAGQRRGSGFRQWRRSGAGLSRLSDRHAARTGFRARCSWTSI